jgi:hypothetical protein
MLNQETFEYGYRNGRQLKHFLVDVTAAGYDNLLCVLIIAFSSDKGGGDYIHSDDYATHMLTDGSRQLSFFFCYGNPRPPSALSSSDFDALYASITAFPEPIQASQAADIVWGWPSSSNTPPTSTMARHTKAGGSSTSNLGSSAAIGMRLSLSSRCGSMCRSRGAVEPGRELFRGINQKRISML